MRRLAFSILILLACGADAASADDQCALHRVASLDMNTDAQGGVGVPMTIDGRVFNMLVDTGGFDSVLTQSTQNTLGLPSFYDMFGPHGAFFGGAKVDHYVITQEIDIGGLQAKKFKFFVIPDSALPRVDGLLGPEILHAFDVDFDFANGKLNLFAPDHCPGRAIYWTKEPVFAQVPMRLDPVGHIKLDLVLDGKPIVALMDTGAPVSYLSFETARTLFGIDPKSPDLKPAGWDNFPGALRYPFKTLTFAGITVNNPEVILIPDDEVATGGSIKALLGMNVLRSLHLYVAYKERTLYLTPASAH